MITLIRKMTPDFKLNISWQNLRLSDHFSHRLKMHVPFTDRTGTVYIMKCVKLCTAEYIGESKRPIHTRVMEHRRLLTSSIENHIRTCEHYKTELSKKYGMTPTSREKISFLENIVFRACNSSDVVYFVYYIIKVINKALGGIHKLR